MNNGKLEVIEKNVKLKVFMAMLFFNVIIVAIFIVMNVFIFTNVAVISGEELEQYNSTSLNNSIIIDSQTFLTTNNMSVNIHYSSNNTKNSLNSVENKFLVKVICVIIADLVMLKIATVLAKLEAFPWIEEHLYDHFQSKEFEKHFIQL